MGFTAQTIARLSPARAVGMADAYGSLEAGKIADLILVARNAAGFGRVERVFVGGEDDAERRGRVLSYRSGKPSLRR